MRDEEEIKDLIQKGESENVEFKTSLSDWKRIVETISAFANTNGGHLIVGVENRGRIRGVKIGKDSIENLTNRIIQNTDPKVYPAIKIVKVAGKNIIVISVKDVQNKPYLAFGKGFKRIGKSTHQMSRDEYERMILEKHKKDIRFDNKICEEATLKDIDRNRVKWFLKEAKKQRRLKISENASLKEIFVKLKLLKDGKLTNAAGLLFAKDPLFLQSEVKCIRFSGNEPVKPYIDFQSIEGTVFDLIDNAQDFVLRNIRKAIWLTPGKVQREEKYEYPPDAIREAIVNAVAHRNYDSPSKVQVRIFDDRIEIWNPGELPEGWTFEHLREEHESIPKNPLLFKHLFWVKYVEDVGGGTLDMIKQCKEWGIAEPEFEYTGSAIIVIFKKSIFTEEVLEQMGLNQRQIKAMEFLREKGSISTKEYCKMFKVARDTANRDLNILLKKGIIKRKGTGPQTYYIFSDISIGQYRTISDNKNGKKE